MNAETAGRELAIQRYMKRAADEWADIHMLATDDPWPEMGLWRAASLIKVLAIETGARRMAHGGQINDVDAEVMKQLMAGLKALYEATAPKATSPELGET